MSQLYADVCAAALNGIAEPAAVAGCWSAGTVDEPIDAADAATQIQLLIPDNDAPPYIRG